MKTLLSKMFIAIVLVMTAGVVCANTITVTASPASIPANGNSFTELTATVLNDQAQPVVGATVDWTTPPNSLGTLIDLSSVTDSAGKAKSRMRAPINTGTTTVTAAAGGISSTTSVKFTGVPSDIVFDTRAWNYFLMADGTSKVTCKVKVTDTSGNPVADGTQVTFTLSSGSVISPVNTSLGYATTIITAPTTAGSTDLVASVGDANVTLSVIFGSSPFETSGRPLVMSIPADGSSKCVIEGTAFGTDGFMPPDGANISFATDNGTLLASNGIVYTGVAQTALQSSTVPGTANVTISYGGQTQTINVPFAGTANTVSVLPSHISIPYGTDHGMRIQVEVRDINNNILPDGTLVELSTTSGTVDPKCILDDGKGTVNLFAASTPGTATITATSGDKTGTTDVYFVGPPSSLTITPELSSVAANGSSTCRLAIDVKDSAGNPVADGTIVNLTTSAGSVSPVVGTIMGYASATLVSSSSPETATVTAVTGSASGSSNVVFAGVPASITLSASPTLLPADASAQAFIVANVADAAGRPAADGTVVTFGTSLGIVSASSTVIGGIATARLTSASTTGDATITATCGTANGSTTVRFN